MIEEYMVWVWLSVFVLTIVIEAISQDLISIWFSLGAIIALILSAFPIIPWYAELVVFAAVSFLVMALTRPLVKKLLLNATRYTNVDEFVGKRVKVITDISKFENGEVKIHDIIYNASLMEEETEPILKDEVVEIVTFKGNKVTISTTSSFKITRTNKTTLKRMNTGIIVAIVLSVVLLVLVILLITRIKIVRQTQKLIIERLGAYHATWSVGFHFLVPFIDRVAQIVSMKEQVSDFDPQPVITKDNVTMQIDTVVFFQITDPKLYSYGVENPIAALENLSSTTLRNIIGELDLDETLTSRDIINTKMRSILDEATDPWGIKVNRVEVKNILPPKDIRDAMERQMRAERERREKILLAEGDKRSQILQAEGERESQILRADAEKQAMIKKAEAEAESILKVKTAEAEGVRLTRQAQADGYKMLVEVGLTKEVLAVKSFEAFEKVSDGQATKIIIPSDMQNLASTIAGVAEVVKDKK